jgi:hypothetical protein
LEKKIELTKALGFPDHVFTDLWKLLPERGKRRERAGTPRTPGTEENEWASERDGDGLGRI